MSNVAILTNFQDLNPGYSLSGIVLDQAQMLSKYGHKVTIYVCEQYNPKFEDQIPYSPYEKAEIKPRIPFGSLIDYQTKEKLTDDHKKLVDQTAKFVRDELEGFDFVFTHDLVFTGWNMPYALGILKEASFYKDLRWFHWIHSIPSGLKDWWTIRAYGPRHKLVFPNATDRLRVAEQFRGSMKHVVVIPHIKDLRTWFDFSPETYRFLDDFPAVMQSEIVQIYPASSDRLKSKRLREVIMIFKYFKSVYNHSVCLVVPNQWATGRQRREDLEKYYKIAHRNGIRRDEEFIFTSTWDKKYQTGISKRMLRELWLCSNLFIFPTLNESFGLVGPEAALSGGKMMVLNRSLDMMFEVNGVTGLYVDFGSFSSAHNVDNEDAYYRDVAAIIIGRIREDDALQASTFHRRRYNYDALYKRVYAPAMAESALWG